MIFRNDPAPHVSRLQKLKSSIQSQNQQLTPLTPLTPDGSLFGNRSTTPKSKKSSKWSLLKKSASNAYLDNSYNGINTNNSTTTYMSSPRRPSGSGVRNFSSSASLKRSSKQSTSPKSATFMTHYQYSPLSPPSTTYRTSQGLSSPSNPPSNLLSKTSKMYAQYLKNTPQSSFQLQLPPKGITPPSPPLDRFGDHDFDLVSTPTPLAPPTVKPYTTKKRRDKSLEDKLCCVCEERIEYTFDGERIVVLQCDDVCHVACLKTFYVETQYMSRSNIETLVAAINTQNGIDHLQAAGIAIPQCPNCDEYAVPVDSRVLNDFCFGDDTDDDNLITVNLDADTLMEMDSLENLSFINNHYSHDHNPLASSAAEESLIHYMDECIPADTNFSKALASPVANFTDCFRLYKQSASVQSAISPWDFEPQTPGSAGPELRVIEQQSPETGTIITRANSICMKRPSSLKLAKHSISPQYPSYGRTSGSYSNYVSYYPSPHSASPNSSFSSAHNSTVVCSPVSHSISYSVSPPTPHILSVSGSPVELSQGIPDAILKIRLKRYKPPVVDLITETTSIQVAGGDSKDMYITSLISVKTPVPPIPSEDPYLSQPDHVDAKVRAQLTVHIKNSIQYWKGRQLELSQFGTLRLHDRFFVSTDGHRWQLLDCYLFENILVFAGTSQVVAYAPRKPPVLKGSIDVRNHLVNIELPPSSFSENISQGSGSEPGSGSGLGPRRLQHFMTMNLSTDNLPTLHFKTEDSVSIENWHTAMINWDYKFPLTRLVAADDYAGQSIASQMYSEESAPDSVRAPTSCHVPTDTVVLIPMSGSPQGAKMPAIKETLRNIISKMQLFDRIAIVPYGKHIPFIGSVTSSNASSFTAKCTYYSLAGSDWQGWSGVLDSLKTTGSSGSRADLIDGLNQALFILQERKSLNPVSAIYVISDSAGTDLTIPPASPTTQSALESVAGRAALDNIIIHSVGVTMNHLADELDILSTKTCGSYHYLRDWADLSSVVVGTFESSQYMGYSDVSLSIGTTSLFQEYEDECSDAIDSDDIVISAISGHNHIRVPVSQDVPLPSPLLQLPTSTEAMSLQEHVKEHLVELGDMAASQHRTFLVQVKVSSEAVLKKMIHQQKSHFNPDQSKEQDNDSLEIDYNGDEKRKAQQLELFHLSLSYKAFTTSPSHGCVYMLPVGGALVPIESYEADLAFPIMDEYSRSLDLAGLGSSASSIYNGGSSRNSQALFKPSQRSRLSSGLRSRSSLASSIFSYYTGTNNFNSPTLSENTIALDLASLDPVLLTTAPYSLSFAASSQDTIKKKNSWIYRGSVDGCLDFPGKPSILFGDLVPRPRKEGKKSKEIQNADRANGSQQLSRHSVSTYLALELYDIHVVLRRIELTAVNLFQYIVRSDLNGFDDEVPTKVYSHVIEARALIQGLYACAVGTKRDEKTGRKKTVRILADEWQTEKEKTLKGRQNRADDEYSDTWKIVEHAKALIAAIEKVLDTVCEHLEMSNIYALQKDYRKVLLQYIGILKNQRAYTKRSPIEKLYYME